jgi:hypothetical protein
MNCPNDTRSLHRVESGIEKPPLIGSLGSAPDKFARHQYWRAPYHAVRGGAGRPLQKQNRAQPFEAQGKKAAPLQKQDQAEASSAPTRATNRA